MKPDRTDPIVGVRELRARLSQYLRDVARGRSVTVGDRRRRPIARLVPIARSKEEEILDDLAARGILRRATGKLIPGRRVKPRGTGKSAADMVIEDRR
jgi:prevent-host-death family protein